MILIKNGKVIENNQLVNKDILIKDSNILKIAENINEEKAKILDAKGCLVMPGAVDVHVHFREPGFEKKETILTGTMAAAKGGVTTVMPMPNLNPCPDNRANLELQLDIIKKDAVVNCYPYGSVSVGEAGLESSSVSEMRDLLTAITDDGRGVNNIELLEAQMELAKKYDLVIASHAEDTVDGYKPQGEYVAVRREVELAKKIGCRYHFCHMSTRESFDAIRKAQKEGFTNITCEVAPHHLIFNEEMIKDANWKMNPPLRSEDNRKATIEALIDGTACMVASDHAPHTEEEKSREYNKCPNGILGIETMLPIIYTEFVKSGIIGLDRFLDIMVYNPIKVFHLPKRALEAGYPADIAVLDIENSHTYTKEEILSKGKNAPYIGMSFYGFPKYTLVNGKVVYKK